MTEPRIAKAGKLICVSNGAYSDYEVTGFFVVLKDFDPVVELACHFDLNPDQKEDYSFRRESYLAGLLAKGLLMEIDYGTLHMGNYCCHDEFMFTPAPENP